MVLLLMIIQRIVIALFFAIRGLLAASSVHYGICILHHFDQNVVKCWWHIVVYG